MATDHHEYPVVKHPLSRSNASRELFDRLYQQSVEDPDAFWGQQARERLTWFQPFLTVGLGSFRHGDVNWFSGGKLNIAYNCVDRHLPLRADQPALLWEGDEPGVTRSITYLELSHEVCRIANFMKRKGVKKGDVVTIYMPMIPEIAMVLLACVRIGAIHSVVFAGFSAFSLAERIENCESRFIFTADQGLRGGKVIPLKKTVDDACNSCPHVTNVFVFRRTGADVAMNEERDIYIEDFLPLEKNFCPCEHMDSEDTSFILYTSGSTGKPKGVAHTTAGYLLHANLSTQWSFDIQDGDVFACVADCGWITGHTYTVYGPLSLGSTTVIFESVPTYPNPYRYWDCVQRHKITQFYTAPTAIRALMKFDSAPIAKYDVSSLRVLGSVGEPINPEAWHWYHEHVGKGKCHISDTYWQTETGGHLATSLPGVHTMRPGSCAHPYFGIQFAVIDSATGKEIEGNGVEGVLCVKSIFPSSTRTIYGDHNRYLNVYTRPYPGYYFTGDGCRRDEDGFYWITGRVDDVINPSGHRIGTAEVEAAIDELDEVSECAVVGFPHDVKGEGIGVFVILKQGLEESAEITQKCKMAVRSSIGAFATPDIVVYSDLPKTRSGKIMRRVLRKIAHGEVDSIGDTSTLADPDVVPVLVKKFVAATGK